ncbi:hypothetical protein J3458_001749 [Metarhizium acridum]|uniref:uncharacterized protein n=1 Tax=Metarhizium acridum TaxID=92637 RepID=UPI001C6D2841|nr:hypothetical protein J3458_001749 [Metarhizium acridum]
MDVIRLNKGSLPKRKDEILLIHVQHPCDVSQEHSGDQPTLAARDLTQPKTGKPTNNLLTGKGEPQDLSSSYGTVPARNSDACRKDSCCIWKHIADEMHDSMVEGKACNGVARGAIRLGFQNAGSRSKSTGRKDSREPAPKGDLPSAFDDADALVGVFEDKTTGPAGLVALLAAHTDYAREYIRPSSLDVYGINDLMECTKALPKFAGSNMI